MDLNFVRIIFTLRVAGDEANPFVLFGSKERFMDAFRQAANCRCSRCESCPRSFECPYCQTFSQTISSDPAAVKRFQKPPFPFVFEFPLVLPAPNRGGFLECGLTLVGSAVNFIADYLAALRIMFQPAGTGRRLNAFLVRVESVDYSGSRHTIFDQDGVALDRLVFLSLAGLQNTNVVTPGPLTLSIITPMRIMQEGRPLRDISFSPFVRALFRRISSMAYYYGGVEMDFDYKWLADRSSGIETVSSKLRWVEWKPGLCGVMGTVTFSGDVADFLPFILLGEHFHVGKGAPFGLGSYRIDSR
ncbi:MAG: hypothetical protein FD174_3093 [Geobacteraceae bacterium]|nr:MAG: hypothetical protein FD174_3093 [Geobacteraceae bacterium]